MSISRKVSVTCPECKKESEFTVWDSINTGLDPQLMRKVRDGSLFSFVCPHCGHEDHVEYGFMYHQMEDRVMIQVVINDREAKHALRMRKDQRFIEMQKELQLEQYHYLERIVVNVNRPREKLAILDSGLDDRIMEIYKVYLLSKYREKLPDVKNTELIYFVTGTGERGFQILPARDQKYIVFNQEFYDMIDKSFLPRLKPIREDGPIIDRAWAERLLEKPKE